MSDSNTSNQRRRPGPIGFSAESAVTSNKISPAPNPGGIANASIPTKETPKSSKELKIAGPTIWGVVGVVLVLVGVISLSIPVVAVGLGLCVASFMVSRMNKTQQRLRAEIRNQSLNKD